LDIAEEQIAHHWAIPLYCFSSPLQIPSRDQQDGSPSVFTFTRSKTCNKIFSSIGLFVMPEKGISKTPSFISFYCFFIYRTIHFFAHHFLFQGGIIMHLYFTSEYASLYEKHEEGEFHEFSYRGPEGHVYFPFLKREIPLKIKGETYFDIISPYG